MQWSDDGTQVWVRQSWLGNALDCAERARYNIVLPDLFTPTSDQAAIGTGVHAGIQNVLEGDIDPQHIGIAARNAVYELCDTETIYFTDYDDPNDMANMAEACALAWVRDIMPYVPMGGQCEVPFEVLDVANVEGVRVHIKGTADYIEPPLDGVVLDDWKSTNRKYEQWKKQRFDHQSAVYSLAHRRGAFGWEDDGLPIIFRFGWVLKGKNPTGHITEVRRTARHDEWVIEKISRFVELALHLGEGRSWPVNEESFMCSKKWCPAYHLCRGKFLTSYEDEKVMVG